MTPAADAGSGTARSRARATLSSLTYEHDLPLPARRHQRAGPSQGADRTFKTATPASAPSISSRAATGVTRLGATLHAGVNPRSLATTVRFEYGTSTSYGTSTPEQPIGAGSSTVR